MSENDWLYATGEAVEMETAMKQIELTNLTFTIKALQFHEFTDKKGNPGQSYIATIRIDGQDEDVEAWLGGVRVMAQIEEIIKRDALPIRVKQAMIEKAYILKLVDGARPTRPAQGGKAQLADYMKANQLKASDVLAAIGEPAKGDVREAWSHVIEKITGLHNVSEDGACALILERLESAAVPEDIPFE